MSIFEQIKAENRMIVSVGSALVDILAHESDDFVLDCGAIKGGMKLVEKATWAERFVLLANAAAGSWVIFTSRICANSASSRNCCAPVRPPEG
jgi:hypothetical protein